MMEFTLSKNSWHYRIANFGERRVRPEWDEGNDICSYIRCFLRGFGTLLAAAAFFILGATWIGYSFFDLGAFILGYNDVIMPPTTIFFGTILILAVGGGIAAFREWLESLPKTEKPERPPTFVELAWTKVHDKTCAKLNFKD